MKKILLAVYIVSGLFSLRAQEAAYFIAWNAKQVDSVKQALRSSSNDTQRMKMARSLAIYHQESDRDTALYYTHIQMRLAKQLHQPFWEADAYEAGGWLLSQIKNYSLSIEYLLTAQKIVSDKNTEKNIWGLEMFAPNFDPSYARITTLGFVHNDLSQLYNQTGDTENELKEIRIGLAIAKPLGNEVLLSLLNSNLAQLKIKLNQPDSVIYYGNLAVDQMRRSGYLTYEGYQLTLTANAYIAKGNLAMAKRYLDSSVYISHKNGSIIKLADAYYSYANLYRAMKQPDSTLRYLNKSATEYARFNLPEKRKQVYGSIYAFYKNCNRSDSAYHYLTLYQSLSDSLAEAEKKQIHSSQNFAFNKQIDQQKLEATRLSKANANRTYAFIAGIALLLMIAFLLLRNNHSRRRANKLLQQQNAEIEQKNRDLEIEAALERVRARTMAMQQIDELADASFLLDSQVRSLGIATRGCVFNIYGEHESSEWFSSADGTMPTYKTPREDIFLRLFEAGKTGTPIYIEEFAGENCRLHYEYLCTLPGIGDGLKEMIKAGGSFPTRQIDHAVYFKYGYLLFITLEPVPEAHDIFIRFGKVFEQTYTRFLDLKKAEEQAQQAEQNLIEITLARKKAEDTLNELRSTQKQLVQSEKMASLGELTAGIAHEIQNPLNFVNNFSEINTEMVDEAKDAIDNGNLDEAKSILQDLKDNSEKINHHGRRADSIVKGMLQHSRTTSSAREPTDLNKLADEYLRLAYHGLRAKDKSFNANLFTDFDEAVGTVDLVPQDIGRVMLNLITNAFYAVGEKAKKTSGYEPRVSVITKRSGKSVSIVVKDNGSGIPPAIIDKIFQPFFTTRPTGQGTGLGLSLAYDIVKAHGGELSVVTREGEGTEFEVRL